MPCYLFTYHGYGTWLPDRSRGYVKRKQGILSTDGTMAQKYRSAMKERVVELNSEIQESIIEIIAESQEKQAFRAHFLATDATHAHLLVSWRDDRVWLLLRSGIKSSMTRHLNASFVRREWFAEGGSRKRVKDREHFDYLVTKYLPKHSGWKWSQEHGKFR